jgi:hypothetical protein
MGVSLKTENEEYAGKTMQIRGSEGGRRGFTGTSMEGFGWQVPRQPSARLPHSLKLVTVVWLLRCSVFRETPMTSAIHFKKLNCYDFRKFLFMSLTGRARIYILRSYKSKCLLYGRFFTGGAW